MTSLESIKKSVQRDVIFMQEGRCKTDLGPLASYFGQVLVGKAEETWPCYEGQPMLPLLQVNVENFVKKPKRF